MEIKDKQAKDRNQVDVCLVSMPFSDVTMPSMALSLLKACLTESGISSCIQYEHLYYVKRYGQARYNQVALRRNDTMAGEIVFSKAAHGQSVKPVEDYIYWMENIRLPWGGGTPEQIEITRCTWHKDLPKWQEEAAVFVEEAAERIMAHQPKIVALVSLFQQNNANIALARRLKQEKNPPVIMVGGSNCMGDLGAALIEYIEAYDYVFLGEADEIFADVCREVLAHGEIPSDRLPYGVLSRCSQKPAAPVYRITQNMDKLPLPDFSDYFAAFFQLFPEGKHRHFMVEGSRGCWWGKNKPCTFCGLHGPARNYREKTTERLVDEIETLAKTNAQSHVCVFTDSILSRKQMKELPEKVRSRGINLIFFAEIKANLTEADIQSLAEAGFGQVQPGIESLQDDVLNIMNKGCRAIKQVETLKHCRAHNINVSWNILGGFPGEKDEYYQEMAELIPKIMHLPAPNQFIHIVYHRYGEYTENPAKYGLHLRPARVYDFVYPTGDFVCRTAYVFEPVEEEALPALWDIRKKGGSWLRVYELADKWIAEGRFPQRLDMEDNGREIEILDMRTIARHLVYHLEGVKADIYRQCRSACTESAIFKALADRYSEQDISAALDWLVAENIMVKIKHEYLALAIDAQIKRKGKCTWKMRF